MTSARPPALVSWSSGKDSAYALHKTLQENRFDVQGLFTTITDTFKRVSMHGVREELLGRQAAETGIPLHKIRIPFPCPNEIYEKKLAEFLRAQKERGIRHVIFGDLFLEDIRHYREKQLTELGMECAFPLWGVDTEVLARDMLKAGFQTRLVCVDLKKLPASFSGRAFDGTLLRDLKNLPLKIDPCGENGEFHTFVHAGPLFKNPIPITVGETVEREGFAFADLLPTSS